MPVPDLTALGARPGGFNSVRLQQAILGADRMPAAHGSMTMPIWDPVFGSTGDQAVTPLRVKNLVDYLKRLQPKS
jgi:hypothetical protein